MPNETRKPTRKPAGWSTVRRHLAAWDKPALLALLKDVYEAAECGKACLTVECLKLTKRLGLRPLQSRHSKVQMTLF